MKIAKYNRAAGSVSKTTPGTAAAGNGSTVDLVPINDKVAALETKVSQLELQLNKVLAAIAGLDEKFLSKFGDRSDYSYALGAIYTDFIQSEMFQNGVGIRLSGSPTAAAEDKYKIIIKDVGWGRVAWATVMQSDVLYVNDNTDGTDVQLTALNVSIGATAAPGYILLDCGAELTRKQCFTEVSRSVMYSVRATIGGQIYTEGYKKAETDSSGNFILYFSNADDISISIRFTYTFAFHKTGSLTSGTIRLYIRGTDYANNRTDCFAAAMKHTEISASGVTIYQGDNGARLTAAGVQTTSDGGQTWS